MQMSLTEYAARFPDRPAPIPAQYAGQWIAWNDERQVIVAHGGDLEQVRREALQRGCAHPVFQKVCPAPFIGCA